MIDYLEYQESERKRKEFMDRYYKDHCCCPNCHSRNFSVTLMAFIFDESHPEKYKDKNWVTCYNCGWKGIRHDLVPEPEETDKLSDKKYWEDQFEQSLHLNTMMELFLKRNGLWDSDWAGVIGARHHYRSNEWQSKYDILDGDFVVCYIQTADNSVTEISFLFSHFLKWQKERSK